MKHIQFRDTRLCVVCMPTYTSFTGVRISKEEYECIESQSCNCEVCNVIKDKLNDYFLEIKEGGNNEEY